MTTKSYTYTRFRFNRKNIPVAYDHTVTRALSGRPIGRPSGSGAKTIDEILEPEKRAELMGLFETGVRIPDLCRKFGISSFMVKRVIIETSALESIRDLLEICPGSIFDLS